MQVPCPDKLEHFNLRLPYIGGWIYTTLTVGFYVDDPLYPDELD